MQNEYAFCLLMTMHTAQKCHFQLFITEVHIQDASRNLWYEHNQSVKHTAQSQ